MLKKVLLFLPLLISLSQAFPEEALLDLRESSFYEHPAKLEGNWEFYWNRLLTPGEALPDNPDSMSIPGSWMDDDKYPRHGFGTYRLKVLLPDTDYELGLRTRYTQNQYRIFLNGSLIAENGNPSREWTPNRNRDQLQIHKLPPLNELELLVQVSNFEDLRGGIMDAFLIGNYEKLELHKKRTEWQDAFIFGVLMISGLLYLSFYINKRNDKSSLFFGLFSLVLGMRTIIYGQHTLLTMFPGFPLALENKIGYLTFCVSVPLFLLFIAFEYDFKWSRIFKYPVNIASLIFVVLILIFPHRIYSRYLVYYQVITLMISLVIFAVIVQRVFQKNSSALVTLIGFLILFGTVINDILYSQGVIQTAHLVPIGLSFFIMSQAALMSWNIGREFSRSEALSMELQQTNNSLKRFVPQEFLKFLGKQKIADVNLGDHTQLEMTIMFCDIREFTTLSENLTPRENFLFLNSYLERIGPIIRQFGGFIDKYVGDGIMALFPGTADTAVKAAIQIQEQIKIYNKHRQSCGYNSIQLGIGIHTGSMMLGTIGENERMDSTVISDAVNLCARIESLTKDYGLLIAMSECTWEAVTDKEFLEERYIGQILVKGKKEPVPIYELFNTDDPETLEAKRQSRADFYKALASFTSGAYEEARTGFLRLLEIMPQDKTSQVYLQRINELKR